jgi:hypothetical protein
MEARTKYRTRARVLFTPLADGTGVVLDLETKFYFTLNRTGVFVWQRLEAEPDNAETLADALSHRFDVDAATAQEDVRRLLLDLVESSLVVEVSA